MNIIPENHQIEGHDNICAFFDDITKDRGKYISPTGSGKTLVQLMALNSFQQRGTHLRKIHAIVSPRIQLAVQHLYSYNKNKKHIIYTGYNECDYLPFALHSGGLQDDGSKFCDFLINNIYCNEIKSGTSVDEVLKAWEHANRLNVDLVVFVTYHSFMRLVEAIEKINENSVYNVAGLSHFDECQYIVSNQFGNILRDTPFEKNVFWTATEKTTKDSVNGLGMKNVATWGEEIHRNTAREMIDGKIILRPRLHILTMKTTGDEFIDAENCVVETYIKHCQESKIGVKLIVNTGGTSFIERLFNGNAVKSELPNVDLFAISSIHGALYYSAKTKITKSLNRRDWINEITDSKTCIIFHYDIISEGIDIDGITGTLIMRNHGLTKVIQIIGRTLRLYIIDRMNKHNLSIDDLGQWQKGYGFVTLPIIEGSDKTNDDIAYIKQVIEWLRSEGYRPEEDVIISEPRGEDDTGDEPDQINKKKKKNKTTQYLNEILDIKNYVEPIESLTRNDKTCSIKIDWSELFDPA